MKKMRFSNKDKKRHKNARFLFFDFGTYVSDSGIVVQNMAVIQDDKGEEEVFPGEDEPFSRNITDNLCNYIFQPKHKGYYVIAHNLRASQYHYLVEIKLIVEL